MNLRLFFLSFFRLLEDRFIPDSATSSGKGPAQAEEKLCTSLPPSCINCLFHHPFLSRLLSAKRHRNRVFHAADQKRDLEQLLSLDVRAIRFAFSFLCTHLCSPIHPPPPNPLTVTLSTDAISRIFFLSPNRSHENSVRFSEKTVYFPCAPYFSSFVGFSRSPPQSPAQVPSRDPDR